MNNIKRVYQQSRLYLGDLNDKDLRIFTRPFPITKMEYTVSRHCDDNGETYGIKDSILNLTIALGENSNARSFLEKMSDMEPSAFSVVFGGDIVNGVLTDYNNLIVFWAYIVEAEESYRMIDEETSNTFLTLRMHLDEIRFADKENDSARILKINR